MPEGRLTHCARGGLHLLRYFGRIDYTLAPTLERFVEPFFAEALLEGFVFDLREASLLDSTNLGLLARLADRASQKGGGRCTIVSTNPDIDAVLRSMGFEEIFDIVRDDDRVLGRESETESAIVLTNPSEDQLQRTMLEAHRALCGVNERDREQFQEVVKWLESGTAER